MAVGFDAVLNLSRAGLINPEQMGYEDSLEIIKDESVKIQKSFVKIGWYLKHIKDNELYREDGYANINECAADQLGYSQSTVSRLINICEKFSKNHNSPELDEKYAGFDKSQMIEMLPMKPEQIEKVTPDMTVKQIRDIKDKVSREDTEESDNVSTIPGQTSIEKDFPEYMPSEPVAFNYSDVENVSQKYATLHKESAAQEDEEDIPDEEVMEGEYREINFPETREPVTAGDIAALHHQKPAYGLEKTEYSERNLLMTTGSTVPLQDEPLVDDAENQNAGDEIRLLQDMLEEAEKLLEAYLDLGDIPEQTVHRQKLIVGAFANMICELKEIQEKEETAAETQQELPMLKNDAQRKQWLNDYKTWGLWYRDDNIDVNYYKFDFVDGSRLVVAEYPKRIPYYGIVERDEHYYHLLEKNKKGYDKRYKGEYHHQADSETYLVEFLKNLQKN